MSRRVLHPKQLPARLPITFTATAGLLLDRFNAPGWVWGIASTLVALLWVGAVMAMAREQRTEIDLGKS